MKSAFSLGVIVSSQVSYNHFQDSWSFGNAQSFIEFYLLEIWSDTFLKLNSIKINFALPFLLAQTDNTT